ncbi:MAG TPA: hypothetical protein VJ965_10920 [Anaerolineales bacterium]|nr:hypothetical protein [Anaerolineales bacterium]
MAENDRKQTRRPLIVVGVLILLVLLWGPLAGWNGTTEASAQSPTPTPDRLAEPPLSEKSTQYEQGTWLYWYHCMPCHGDFGQGLTDDFIELWPPDHQNCWGRGCHGGRMEDEGFPIPKTVPAIIDGDGGVLKFAKPDELYDYLYSTHPPQNPGVLTEDEYWAIADFVLVRNNLLPEEKEIGADAGKSPVDPPVRNRVLELLF